MATPEPKAEGNSEVKHSESKEKLTSVTDHEKFSVPEGHEVTVIQHTTNNAEAVVSVSSESVNAAPPGKLAALAHGNVVQANPPSDGDGHDKTVEDAVAPTAVAHVSDAPPAAKEVDSPVSKTMEPTVPNVVEEIKEKEEVPAEAAHSSNCLVDTTSTLIKAEEPKVTAETATQDKAIVPDEEPVSPAVNRPRRPPPPPSQVPPNIVPSTSEKVWTQPRVNGTASTSDPNLKEKSLRRFQQLGSSMRKTFNQVKTKLKPKRRVGKDDKARSTTGVDGSGQVSLYSSTDFYSSQPSSITNTPKIPRKEDQITKAIPDLQIAMGDDPGSSSQAEVLSWTAKSIAVDASQRRGVAEPFEHAVQPMHVARVKSPQHGLLAQMTPETMGSAQVSPPPGDSRKPPVSPTRPATEYNHNRSDREPSTRRPGTFWGGLSLDRRQNEQVRRHVPLEIRRTQTLRTTDYSARLQDRLRRYQMESHHEESTQPDDYKRKTLRTEVTERSDKVSWPFKALSFRNKRPPKKVYAVGQDPNARRVKPRPNTVSQCSDDIVPKMEGPVHVAPPIMVQKVSPQRITPPCLSREVTNSSPVLTSLESHKTRMTARQQMSKGIHVGARPVSHLVMHSDEPVGQAAPLPYFSDTLAKTVNWNQVEANLALSSGVQEIHPFLAAWTVELAPGDEANDEFDEKPTKAEVDVTCLQYYLTNCLKLYSANLQGEFAPFHYPLSDSHVRHWPQCVILDDCEEVRILREPHLDTEYLELVNMVEGNIGQRTLFYATQPIDHLLTAWLDCGSTVRATAGAIVRETPAYHPVQLVAKLSQVLDLDGQHNGLLETCLRLAVLLTYNYVKTQCHSLIHDDVSLDTQANHITLFMTTTNCIVAFTKKAKEEATKKLTSDEPKTPEAVAAVSAEATVTEDRSNAPITSTEQTGEETETAETPASPVAGTSAEPQPEQPTELAVDFELVTLLKSIKCDKCTTCEEAIDKVISEIRTLAASPPTAHSLAVSMMRAVVPPDWMAMTLARVCIAKE